MFEDSAMENKNLRPNGPVSTEVKTNKSDTTNAVGKVQGRGGKKRENGSTAQWVPGGNLSSGSLLAGCSKTTKPIQSKSKGCDKRNKFKPFGYIGHGSHRKNDHQITDPFDPDLDSILPENGKKQNLAHLLNMKFQFAPREATSPYWQATHSTGSKNSRHGIYSSNSRSFSKDHYLQANCQFVVKADRDYTVYLADPDLLVPWETIEQIRIWGSEVASCPICLHVPVAARMTRCGHIYCWPCILHFLALSDKPSRPCPICDAAVRIPDLKSVVALQQRQLNVGDVVDMRLMKRDRHSLIPQPVFHSSSEGGVCPTAKPLFLSKAGANHVFSKLLLCTPEEVVSEILQSEKAQLLVQYADEKDCPESCFIQQALELLAIREREIVSAVAVSAASSTFEALSLSNEAVEKPKPGTNVLNAELSDTLLAATDVRSRYTSTSSDGITDHLLTCEGIDVAHSGHDRISMGSPPNQPQQQKNVFYFYQSSDGQAIFLHSLNVQMLVRHFGTLEQCPEVIEGRIVESESLSMNDEVRNRFRYLGHIPISKQFQIVEIAFKEPVIDESILQEFKDRIEDREHRRRRKERDERRRDLEIQRAEDAKWGRTQSKPIVRLDSQLHFPQFSPPSVADWDPLVSTETDGDIEYSMQQEMKQEARNQGPSFAQMLRQGKTGPAIWPAVSKNVAKDPLPSIGCHSRFRSESENDQNPEDYNSVPEYRETFSSALAAAFDKAAKPIGGSSISGQSESNQQMKKGKRKVKQKVLFATGMNFM